jgi:hypothetical protein
MLSKNLEISINFNWPKGLIIFYQKNEAFLLTCLLSLISILSFVNFFINGLGLAYNDARSHLDIGRRVVEGLKPGFAQLGSVWLPLPHILMVPTIWNDFMWHSGLSGALVSMASFIALGVLIYKFLKQLKVGVLGRLAALLVFVCNINILYLQSTPMTELLLLATMTASVYDLLLWHKNEKILHLIKAGFWVMLSTLVRYDGWFLLLYACLLIVIHVAQFKGILKIKSVLKNYTRVEGTVLLFATLGFLGIFLWLLWNLLIFKDPLYFAFGPYSAHAQQQQLESAGNLATKHNLLYSIYIYFYALIYNSGAYIAFLGLLGVLVMIFDKKIKTPIKLAVSALFAPLIFNIIALYMGHSVLYIQGLSGNTWFNVRYGVMMMPSIAIFVGYLIHKLSTLRAVLIGSLLLVLFFTFASYDAVTIDDAKEGASQKNVSEVSSWLKKNAKDQKGFVLVSAASHDAIIFSSDLPMSKFIHEGTGKYWDLATTNPDKWARWIIMRTHDDNDSTYRLISKTPDIKNYILVEKYPFADIYELKPEYLDNLVTTPILGPQK